MGTFLHLDGDEAGRLPKHQLVNLQQSMEVVKQDDRDYYIIDDMLFPKNELDLKGGFFGNIWTDSKVFYEFNANVTNANQTNFLNAAAEWSDITSIQFIRRNGEANYIHVQDDTVNSSPVGMVGGKQTMKITSWNWKFIIAHEIAHALGMVHEQCRNDRDTFVVINTSNIVSGREHNFAIGPSSNYTPYDFSSIMHYDRFAFSKNGLQTISAQPAYAAQEANMGNRNYLTSKDAASMVIRYGIR
jgi:hypothetical protein